MLCKKQKLIIFLNILFQYTFKTVDCQGCHLMFKGPFIQVENRVLVDFCLSCGCGLEF